jgi:hypothetical protein
VLRWLLFEAAKTSARSCAPGYRYYTDVKERYDANRAALSQARLIVRHAVHNLDDLGEDVPESCRDEASTMGSPYSPFRPSPHL